jgi:hypothetical protein
MWLEPALLYNCPLCGNVISNQSILSGNSRGTIAYSDGRNLSPNMWQFPLLSKCRKCDTIFWLYGGKHDSKDFDYFDDNVDKNIKDEIKVDVAKFLTLKEYFKALDQKLYTTYEEELYIRQRIWWGFNNRLRNVISWRHFHLKIWWGFHIIIKPIAKLFTSQKNKKLWKDNAVKLLSLLNPENIHQKIMIAEIQRNLGNFEKCLKTVESINDEEFSFIKISFVRKCALKNRDVFELKLE